MVNKLLIINTIGCRGLFIYFMYGNVIIYELKKCYFFMI